LAAPQAKAETTGGAETLVRDRLARAGWSPVAIEHILGLDVARPQVDRILAEHIAKNDVVVHLRNDGGATPGGALSPREPEIARALDALSGMLNLTHASAEQLLARLEPVLRPSMPEPAGPNAGTPTRATLPAVPESSVPIVQILADRLAGTRAVWQILTSAIDRLEV
jgi:hypothetical protein